MSHLGIITGFFVACLLHASVILWADIPQGKTESNFFSNRARLQMARAINYPKAIFVGSSITGRLPCHEKENLINLGCDGGASSQGLQAISEGLFPHAPVCFVEVNRMLSEEGSLLEFGTDSISNFLWKTPIMRSDYRPSSLFYRYLIHLKNKETYSWKNREPVRLKWEKSVRESKHQQQGNRIEKFQTLVEKVKAISPDTRIIFVFYPVGYNLGSWPDGGPEDARYLAEHLGCEFLDLHRMKFDTPIGFSDTTHLDADSARFILECLLYSVSQ